ncbi:MAG: hypothetical protein M0R22_11270, partial [Dehalococcoidia bacterium]|nr:hypothetical protein [Dehalococcoidia bacterium]
APVNGCVLFATVTTVLLMVVDSAVHVLLVSWRLGMTVTFRLGDTDASWSDAGMMGRLFGVAACWLALLPLLVEYVGFSRMSAPSPRGGFSAFVRVAASIGTSAVVTTRWARPRAELVIPAAVSVCFAAVTTIATLPRPGLFGVELAVALFPVAVAAWLNVADKAAAGRVGRDGTLILLAVATLLRIFAAASRRMWPAAWPLASCVDTAGILLALVRPVRDAVYAGVHQPATEPGDSPPMP